MFLVIDSSGITRTSPYITYHEFQGIIRPGIIRPSILRPGSVVCVREYMSSLLYTTIIMVDTTTIMVDILQSSAASHLPTPDGEQNAHSGDHSALMVMEYVCGGIR